jgi:uncharacterized protein YkwD
MIKFLYAIFLSILFAIFMILNFRMDPEPPIVYPTPTPVVLNQSKLFDLVQEFREENDLPPYTESKISCQLADERIKDILTDFSHDGFYQRIALPPYSTYSYTFYRENLAKDYSSEKKTLDGWLKSASHSASLYADMPYSCLRCQGTMCVHIMSTH